MTRFNYYTFFIRCVCISRRVLPALHVRQTINKLRKWDYVRGRGVDEVNQPANYIFSTALDLIRLQRIDIGSCNKLLNQIRPTSRLASLAIQKVLK